MPAKRVEQPGRPLPLDHGAQAAGLRPLRRMLAYAPPGDSLEVPDPYYGPPAGFEQVLDRIESSLDGLVGELRRRLAQLPL